MMGTSFWISTICSVGGANLLLAGGGMLGVSSEKARFVPRLTKDASLLPDETCLPGKACWQCYWLPILESVASVAASSMNDFGETVVVANDSVG
jgi:hypothetical protein